MRDILGEYLLGSPLSRLAVVAVLLVGFLGAVPLAAALRWNVWGTRIALWGFGGALIPTFVHRIGMLDAGVDLGAVGTCLDSISPTWLDPSSIANLLLLVPFGVGLLLASRSVMLAALAVIVVGLGIEIGQQVTGLGACERGDLIRNVGGALVAVAVTELAIQATRRHAPAEAVVPHRS